MNPIIDLLSRVRRRRAAGVADGERKHEAVPDRPGANGGTGENVVRFRPKPAPAVSGLDDDPGPSAA